MQDFSIGSWLLLIKILAVVLFIYLTTPTSSHALMRAAFEDDEMPMTEEDLKKSKKRGKEEVMIGLEIFNTFILLLLLVVAAVTSLWVKDLLVSAVVFGVYSFLMCLLWAEMGAVDVAFTEATVGAGISTVVLGSHYFSFKEKSND